MERLEWHRAKKEDRKTEVGPDTGYGMFGHFGIIDGDKIGR